MAIVQFPSKETLDQLREATPDYMHPNMLPDIIFVEKAFSKDEVDTIVGAGSAFEPYHFHGCNAITREFDYSWVSTVDALLPVTNFVMDMNDEVWGFDIPRVGAWLQTYEKGHWYKPHTDTYPGQSRKLSAVLFLSNPEDYEGGMLAITSFGNEVDFQPPRGSIVIFPSWLQHRVHQVREGKRQTVNFGFYGPTFK